MSDIEQGHNTATPDEKIAGIVEQMRGDIDQGNVTDAREALRQRLADADIELSETEFEGILSKLS
jgi:hypothetical protein